jgi:hypothetical protein
MKQAQITALLTDYQAESMTLVLASEGSQRIELG